MTNARKLCVVEEPPRETAYATSDTCHNLYSGKTAYSTGTDQPRKWVVLVTCRNCHGLALARCTVCNKTGRVPVWVSAMHYTACPSRDARFGKVFN